MGVRVPAQERHQGDEHYQPKGSLQRLERRKGCTLANGICQNQLDAVRLEVMKRGEHGSEPLELIRHVSGVRRFTPGDDTAAGSRLDRLERGDVWKLVGEQDLDRQRKLLGQNQPELGDWPAATGAKVHDSRSLRAP